MNERAKALSLFSAVMHAAIAASLWWSIGGYGDSGAWQIMGRALPEWIWALLFGVVGLLALCGTFDLRYLRAAFRLGAALMAVWATASLVAFVEGTRAALPGALLLGLFAGLKLMIAAWSLREQRVVVTEAKVVELGETARALERERGGW